MQQRMKQNLLKFELITFLCGAGAIADELIPATSQDAAQFDKDIANARAKGLATAEGKKSARRMNFGAKVSVEAQKMGSEIADQRKTFGKWVSSQRAQGD